MQNECIICRKKCTDFSDEHVIPEAMGGYYHIHNVCKVCNSKLGQYVDQKLVNHKFSEFQRFFLNLKGKTGNIPNPLSGDHYLKGDTKTKIRMDIGNDGTLKPYLIPNISCQKINDNGEKHWNLKIILDTKDKDKLTDIVNKYSKKLDISITVPENISIHSIPRPEIEASFSIDLYKFKIGLLKIAYEFAVDKIPDFYNSTSAKEISLILQTADYKKAEKFVKIGTGFEKSDSTPFEQYLDFSSRKHYLVLVSTEKYGLLCFIYLHETFSIGIALCDHIYFTNDIYIGVNDIANKSFKFFDNFGLEREIYRTSHQFEYFFPAEKELQDFILLNKQDNFHILIENNTYPIFDNTGNRLSYSLEQFLEKNEYKINIGSNGLIVSQWDFFESNIYIKIKPSEKYIRIVGFKIIKEQFKKL